MCSRMEYIGPCDNTLNVSIRIRPLSAASKPKKRFHALYVRFLGDRRPVRLLFSEISNCILAVKTKGRSGGDQRKVFA